MVAGDVTKKNTIPDDVNDLLCREKRTSLINRHIKFVGHYNYSLVKI